MNKQSIAIKQERDKCISSVKSVLGKNCQYFSPDKCIYYSPNRTVPNKMKIHAIPNNLRDLYKEAKLFKAENPCEKVKIIKV